METALIQRSYCCTIYNSVSVYLSSSTWNLELGTVPIIYFISRIKEKLSKMIIFCLIYGIKTTLHILVMNVKLVACVSSN